MQARVDLDVMAFMFSDGFRILNTVMLLVLVIFQNIVVAVSPNPTRCRRLSNMMRRDLLIVPVLVLGSSSGRGKQCEYCDCENGTLQVFSCKRNSDFSIPD